MKKYSLIALTIALFAGGMYLSFLQGSIATKLSAPSLAIVSSSSAQSAVVYTGIAAVFANGFISIMNTLLSISGGNALYAITLLALLVELLLLYPSIRIQIKQKKIHTFHKKLVDKFQKGELGYSKTKHELEQLYDVNEKIHSRGAIFVVIQIIVFLSVMWGLNLLTQVPYLITGKWDIFNASLLSKPETFAIPLIVSLVYFLHALTKIYYKDREDYISPVQTGVAITLAVLGAVLVYFFSTVFATALSAYFVTLASFATIRYIIVEQHAKAWGKLAQKELMKSLSEAKPHKNRFEYISRKWNHLPVVRHLNFNLLEEALSMTIGLLLALNFFGALQQTEENISHLPTVAVAAGNLGQQTCITNTSASDIPIFDSASDVSTWPNTDYYWIFGQISNNLSDIEYATLSKTADATPKFFCMPSDVAGAALSTAHQVVQMEAIDGDNPCTSFVDTPTNTTLYQCGYRVTQIPDVSITCPSLPVVTGETVQLIPAGGSAAYYTNPTVSDFFTFDTDALLYGSTLDANGAYTASTSTTGVETITVKDKNNPDNSATCQFQVNPAPTACQSDIKLRTHLGQTLKEGIGSFNFDVYSNTTYRLYVDNSVVPNSIANQIIDDQNSIIQNLRQEDNFVEFTVDPAQTVGSAEIAIWDPNVEGSEPGDNTIDPCRFNVTLNLAGGGITKITPTYVNVGL